MGSIKPSVYYDTRRELPIIFDLDNPKSTFTETVRTLALLSRFIIVDTTDLKSIPQELQAIFEHVHVPVQLILEEQAHQAGQVTDKWEKEWPWGMHKDFTAFPWLIRDVFCYPDLKGLNDGVPRYVITSAERKVEELQNDKVVTLRKVWIQNKPETRLE